MEINKGGDYERRNPSSLFSRNQEGRGGVIKFYVKQFWEIVRRNGGSVQLII